MPRSERNQSDTSRHEGCEKVAKEGKIQSNPVEILELKIIKTEGEILLERLSEQKKKKQINK